MLIVVGVHRRHRYSGNAERRDERRDRNRAAAGTDLHRLFAEQVDEPGAEPEAGLGVEGSPERRVVDTGVEARQTVIGQALVFGGISVIQNAVYLPIVILGTIGWLAPETSNGLAFVTLVWVLVYTWFVTRTALDVPGHVAGGLVIVDLLLSVLINAITDDMLS